MYCLQLVTIATVTVNCITLSRTFFIYGTVSECRYSTSTDLLQQEESIAEVRN